MMKTQQLYFQQDQVKIYTIKKNIENITDIDLFIVCEQNEDQIRRQEQFNGVEFDINKFSKRYIEFMIENKEYFFINEMRNAKVIYDKKKYI